MYTWELDNWPAYRFDQKSAELWTNKALAASQKILGVMAVVPTSLGSEAKLDLLASAAIAYLWFETIHPYSSSRSSISTVRASASAFSTFAEPTLLPASI